MDIVVGIVGAIIGGFIMRALGFADQGGLIYTILSQSSELFFSRCSFVL